MQYRLVINKEVLDDSVHRTSTNLSSSLPYINGDMMSPSNTRGSTTCPNHGLAVPHSITISSPNHGGQPATLSGPRMSDAPSSSISYTCYNGTQELEQCLTQSVSGFNPLSSCASLHNPPTLHSHSSHYDLVLGGTCTPAMRHNYWLSQAFQMYYPDVYPEVPTSDFRLYNEPSHQWQNSAMHQPGLPNELLPPMKPPPLAAEALQLRFSSQARASHGGIICYPSDHPPIANQPYLTPLLLLHSCRWLYDDAPCKFTGTLDELKAHCKRSHFAGPPDAQIECRWEACTYHRRDDPTVHVMRR
ncbi:hypothetical protein DFJ58DRAFT_819666 [Suillus subalutaceus]|uniref:uncharacterized protein n=1 Tax=Suillus subalutaceus TaxID=48586 RepID=UPI001B881F6F|nr:uncharacterized protein DFJ58DRAFT_819666 [Suillus subalutaceus]KAG1836081.1 hypothetical protein DFJ58DRAFT_819666 [Suillus subalutaceus]